jgi:hypothetical protein
MFKTLSCGVKETLSAICILYTLYKIHTFHTHSGGFWHGGSFAQKPLTPAESKYEKVAIFPASYLKWVLKQNRKLSSFKTKRNGTQQSRIFTFIL